MQARERKVLISTTPVRKLGYKVREQTDGVGHVQRRDFEYISRRILRLVRWMRKSIYGCIERKEASIYYIVLFYMLLIKSQFFDHLNTLISLLCV